MTEASASVCLILAMALTVGNTVHQRSDYWTLITSRFELVYLLYIRSLGKVYARGAVRKGHFFHASGMKG